MATTVEVTAHEDERAAAPLLAWWLALATWFVLGVVLPWAWARDFFETLGSTPGILALAVIQLSAVAIAVLIVAGQARYMAYFFWVFTYVWFGLSAFLQVDDGRFDRRIAFVGTSYSPTIFTRTLLLVLWGCAFYLLGTHLRSRWGSRPAQPGGPTTHLSVARVRLIAVVGSLGGLALIVRAGPTLFSSREGVARASIEFTRAASVVSFLAAYLIVYAFRHGRVHRWSDLGFPTQTLFVGALGIAVLANNPFIVQRAITAAFFGALLLAWTSPSSRVSRRTVFLLIPVAILVVFPALNDFRYEESDSTYSDKIAGDFAAPLRNGTGDFGMFTQVADGVEYVDQYEHTNGRHLLAAAFVYVPRSIWQGKAYDVGDTVHQQLGYDDRFNYSSPLWMELYVEGGYPLVILGFFGVGWASRSLELAFARSAGSRGGVMLPAIACYQLYLLRGSLQAAAPMFGLMLVVLAYASRRDRAPAPDAAVLSAPSTASP